MLMQGFLSRILSQIYEPIGVVEYPYPETRLTPINQNYIKLPDKQERVKRIAEKIHMLPLRKFYTEEVLWTWSMRRIQKALKVNNLKPKSENQQQLIQQLLDSQKSDTCCSICFEDYEHDDVLRILRCGHEFHVECIDRWSLSSTDFSKLPECPLCKKQI